MLTSLPSSTGEKIHHCPDAIQVLGPSGSLNREERCKYRTNNCSLLTKYRKIAHGYLPHLTASSENTGILESVFVFHDTPSSRPATTSRVSKPKRARTPKTAVWRAKSTRTSAAGKVKDSTGHAETTALDGSLPSTSQQGADEYDRANVELPDATDPSSTGFTNAASVTPNGDMASEAHARVHAELPDRTSSNCNTSVTPISLATHGRPMRNHRSARVRAKF
jgi:hypothetical protein